MVETEDRVKMLDDPLALRITCRKFQAICHKYPFTAEERETIEHLWAEIEDKWLDAELSELEDKCL